MNQSMKHCVEMQIRNIEGALVRALGLAERRGFRVLGVELGDDDAEHKSLTLTVQSERCVSMLQRQLEKLHDVSHVTIVGNINMAQVATAG